MEMKAMAMQTNWHLILWCLN